MSEAAEKAGSTDGQAPHKGAMDMQDAIDHILVSPTETSPEETTPKDEPEVTAAKAATTKESTDAFSEPEAEAAEKEAASEDAEPEENQEEESNETDEKEPDVAQDEEDEDDAVVMFTTPDGTEVNLDELKRGYLRQSDYTKKTQEVAEARKHVEQSFQTYEQHQNLLAQNLEMALNVVEPQLAHFAKTNWDALAASDAYEYAEQRALYDQAQARYSQLQSASQQLVAQAQAQRTQAKQGMLLAERQKLQMALPDMADPVEGRRLAGAIKEYSLSTVGLSQEEASNITDHRLIVALNKARMYDELNESTLSASRKKIQKGPKKVMKGGQPTTKTQQKAQTNKAKRSKLRNSGSVDDAVDWLLTAG